MPAARGQTDLAGRSGRWRLCTLYGLDNRAAGADPADDPGRLDDLPLLGSSGLGCIVERNLAEEWPTP